LLPGTFAGTTALSIALALPEDGQMVTIDFKEDWVATGRPLWQKDTCDSLLFVEAKKNVTTN